ncbi:YicC family protein [Selenomonas sp. TAMA-11512]|uniref:YicC/YloC family endoribonuclease n=1 Tax=Selenomonas sp. TAMA-11512 TaxID=3095337 RepID=UPI003089F131|nr:YicC family protein [Selenomonas sp. TAMA-11512]
MRSMTGFGSAVHEDEDCRLQIEIKAVNHRFLDVTFYMPRSLAPYEQAMRQRLKERVARGKVEVYISFIDRREKESEVRVDAGLAGSYKRALTKLAEELHVPLNIDAKLLADYPDVLKVEEINEDFPALKELLPDTLSRAVDAFIAMRETEGEHIARDFAERLAALRRCREELVALAPRIVENYRTRLEETLEEVLSAHETELDAARLVQEVAIYAERVDYHEEVVRLESHFAQFEQLMTADAAVGRKLDFLMQEMNREVNTVGSKASHADAAHIVVDMKGEVEKLREQVQNIE